MNISSLLEALILGLAQGLAEFLPISSSGHLKIIPWFFGWTTPGLVFDTSLHLGTSLALLLFFYKDFKDIVLSFLAPKTFATKEEAEKIRKLGYYIVIGMLPAGILGLLFDKNIEALFPEQMQDHHALLIAVTLSLFGLLLYGVDKWNRGKKEVKDLTILDALLVGTFQILALFPGVSRSGITMTGGMLRGFSRENAARFSFLVGAPLTFAAGVFKLKDLAEITLTNETIAYFVVGFLGSAISGYLCIKYFLKFLQSHSVGVFTLYRILFALIIVLVTIVR